MDPRLKLLIEGVQLTHVPLFTKGLHGQPKVKPYCYACKGLVEHPCPVRQAADELEKENG